MKVMVIILSAKKNGWTPTVKFIEFCVFSMKYLLLAGKTVYLNKVINILEKKTPLYLIILHDIKTQKNVQTKLQINNKYLLLFNRYLKVLCFK